MNLPNKITAGRLFLTLIIILLLVIPFSSFGFRFPQYDITVGSASITVELHYLIAGVLFIIASLTDFFDGHLARKYHMVTDTGKMLDAIADKVLVNPILIILAANGSINGLAPKISVIIPVIYVTRDIVVDAIKMQAASKGKVQAAIKTGKIKTAAMMTGIVLVFFYNMPFEFINVRVDLFLLYFACIMSVVSAIEYFKINKELIFGKKGK